MPGEGPGSAVLGGKLVQLVREENDGAAARARIFPALVRAGEPRVSEGRDDVADDK